MSALIVDEPRLHDVGTPTARGWWAAFRGMCLTDRCRDLQATPTGCVREIRCRDRADADALLRTLMANGMPRSAVRITR